jgi:hypothetical protein
MSRASSSPEIARGQMSSSRPTLSRKSSPFLASRTAEVATESILSAPAFSARRLYLRSTSTARFMAAADRRPRERLLAPRRTISFSRPMTRKVPAWSVSTRTMCSELLPRSMAAILI